MALMQQPTKAKVINQRTSAEGPASGDGLNMTRLSHHGDVHIDRWPVECVQRRKDVVTELRRLGVGLQGEGRGEP